MKQRYGRDFGGPSSGAGGFFGGSGFGGGPSGGGFISWIMCWEVLNIIYSIDTSSLNKLCIVSAALYILKYKDIVTNFDIVSNEKNNINEELMVDALNLLLQ